MVGPALVVGGFVLRVREGRRVVLPKLFPIRVACRAHPTNTPFLSAESKAPSHPAQ